MRSSCDLKFSGFSNNLREVSGTVFISLNCCKSTAFVEVRGGSMFSMCVSVFFFSCAFACARARARARRTDRCVSMCES